jgi:hypothetical protein
MVRRGEATVADGSTEGFSPLCCSLLRVVGVQLGGARHDMARCGVAWYGRVIVADGSTEGLGSPCCSLRRVVAVRSNMTGQGAVRRSKVMQQLQKAAQGISVPSAALYEEWLWNGALRSGKMWRGKIRFGLAWLIAADGSTGAFGLLCCSRKGVVMARQGLVGYGKARSGHAWCGRVNGALRRPFKLKTQSAP